MKTGNKRQSSAKRSCLKYEMNFKQDLIIQNYEGTKVFSTVFFWNSLGVTPNAALKQVAK